jgi:hypothetical protein
MMGIAQEVPPMVAALFDLLLFGLGAVLALELLADLLESLTGLLGTLFGGFAGFLGGSLERMAGFYRGLVDVLAGALYGPFGVLVLVTADRQRGEEAHGE